MGTAVLFVVGMKREQNIQGSRVDGIHLRTSFLVEDHPQKIGCKVHFRIGLHEWQSRRMAIRTGGDAGHLAKKAQQVKPPALSVAQVGSLGIEC